MRPTSLAEQHLWRQTGFLIAVTVLGLVVNIFVSLANLEGGVAFFDPDLPLLENENPPPSAYPWIGFLQFASLMIVVLSAVVTVLLGEILAGHMALPFRVFIWVFVGCATICGLLANSVFTYGSLYPEDEVGIRMLFGLGRYWQSGQFLFFGLASLMVGVGAFSGGVLPKWMLWLIPSISAVTVILSVVGLNYNLPIMRSSLNGLILEILLVVIGAYIFIVSYTPLPEPAETQID